LIFVFNNEARPFIYKGIRLGKNEQLFYQYKFRTLKQNAEQLIDEKGNVIVLDDDCRLNKVGFFLRNYHLDEILQLINVFKGDMSFVGPRPIPPNIQQIDIYDRHSIPPGLVGFQVIIGRNLSWRNKQKLDYFYLKRISLKLYFYIFFIAIIKILHNIFGRNK